MPLVYNNVLDHRERVAAVGPVGEHHEVARGVPPYRSRRGRTGWHLA